MKGYMSCLEQRGKKGRVVSTISDLLKRPGGVVYLNTKTLTFLNYPVAALADLLFLMRTTNGADQFMHSHVLFSDIVFICLDTGTHIFCGYFYLALMAVKQKIAKF